MIAREELKMKDIHILQHSYKSINSVFSFTNVFNKDYLNQLLDKTIELTNSDKMHRATNVIANMTEYTELLKHEAYNQLFITTLELLNFCWRRRQ